MRSKGWIVKRNANTCVYDFKTGKISKNDILTFNQVVNHFPNVKCVTTKYGLTKTMKYCLWEKGINTLKFFPRSYYINDISELLDFLEDYKYTLVKYKLKAIF